MEAHKDDLEPRPSIARDLYLDHKATHCTEATVQGEYYRPRHIVNWRDSIPYNYIQCR
jgi:hypothetical protein